MKVEIRADGVHISGYVNVPGKMSKPVITSKGQRVIEVIEERAFERALIKNSNVPMTLDHQANIVLAATGNHSLELREDAIGLRAETVITNPKVIEGARAGKLKGWSFGMKDIIDNIEPRAEGLPIRHVKDFYLDHITLVMDKNPAYSATSIELRADDSLDEIETRASDTELSVTDMVETPKEPINYSKYDTRLEEIRAGK